MKKSIKLMLGIICFCMAIAATSNAQTQDWVPKFDNLGFPVINSQIYDDPTSGDVQVGTGSVDVMSSTNGYKIGSSTYPILWHNGITSSIYVGEGAGNTYGATNNTLVGYNAGPIAGQSGNGYSNTLIGSQAGLITD